MNVAVRYQSRGGNTRAVAVAIAKAAGVTAEALDAPLEGTADVLFIGGGVYGANADPALKAFLNGLTPQTAKAVALFSTSSLYGFSFKEMINLLNGKGITTLPDTLLMRFGTRNLSFLGGKGSVELTDKQVQTINAFVAKSLKN